MRHARPAALDQLEPLLGQLRELGALQEKSRGVFYLRSKAFPHFHEDPAGLFADVRTADGQEFVRLRVDGSAGAASLLQHVRSALASRA